MAYSFAAVVKATAASHRNYMAMTAECLESATVAGEQHSVIGIAKFLCHFKIKDITRPPLLRVRRVGSHSALRTRKIDIRTEEGQTREILGT